MLSGGLLKRVICFLLVVMVAVMVAPALALAAEPPVEAPDIPWFGHVQLWELVAAVAVFIWGIVKAKAKLDERWDKRLLTFIEAGVQHTYDSFVREAKTAAPNGKLTKEQIDEARGKAWEAAKEYAQEKGIDLAKQVAVEQVPVLITKVVNALKALKALGTKK